VSDASALTLSPTTAIRFNPAQDYNGAAPALTAHLADNTATVTDGGHIDISAPGATGGTTAWSTGTVSLAETVNAVDDAPVNHVPAAQTINEDASRTFSAANSNAITVSDVDAGAGNVTVTLSVGHGIITLGSTANITATGNGTGSVQVTGTVANVNTALDGLVYAPTANFNGDDTIHVVTSDNGNTGTGGPLTDTDDVVVHVTAVNDAPTVVNGGTETLPAIDEDTPSATGATVSSLFGGHYSDAADAVPGGSSAGAFTGIAITANGSSAGTGQWQYYNGSTWVDIGTVSDASALTLSPTTAIRFNPAQDYNGAAPALTAHLADNTVAITDGGHIDLSGVGATGGTTAWSTGTVSLAETVNPVNDAPVIDLDSGAAGANSSANFTEGDPAVHLAPAGTVVDIDSPDFDGATLTVQFTSGSTPEDTLQVIGLDPDAGGQIFNGSNELIATVGGGSGPSDPLVITFTANATAADVQSVMHMVGYADYSQNLVGGDRTISFTLTDGDGGTSNVATATVHVTSVDTPPTANDDQFSTPEDTVATIAVLGNDFDPDGPNPAVMEINGTPVSAGQTVTLASGAKVTLNANGTLSYDPNHKFDTLTSPAGGETGASNTQANDTFTYSIQGGDTATVTMTVTGVANAADHLDGSAGNDTVTGTPHADFFDFSQGGSDSGFGLGGDDAFYFGSAYDQNDKVDGGAGTDTVGLRGNYTGPGAVTILGGNMVNVETLTLMTSNGGPVGYDISWQDGNLANGQKMTIYAGGLQTGENVTFDGSAETHGYFVMYGGLGTDTFTGGAGNDGFYFGPGKFSQADHVDGGGGVQNQLGLDGSYNFSAASALGTLGGNFANIQTIVLYAGDPRDVSNPYPNTYHIETNDLAVAAGKSLNIFAVQTIADFYFNGSAETDGSFKIFSGSGNDTLIGSANGDLIYGNLGADTMTGGGGDDVFLFTDVAQSTGPGTDRITDFTLGDKIDLSQIDADTTLAGDQSFNFIGSGGFSNHAGELRAEYDAAHGVWTVQGDVNGDGVADITILVQTTNNHPIVTTDFIL
jgi:Ca2+-binding RTX toxin-like protein